VGMLLILSGLLAMQTLLERAHVTQINVQ